MTDDPAARRDVSEDVYDEDFDWANLDPDPDAPPLDEQIEYMRQHRPPKDVT